MLHRFTAWLGNNSSTGKQRRLMGELHTRMTSSGHVATDRTGLRTAYLPTLRYALSKPLASQDKEGIPMVINTMQARTHQKLVLPMRGPIVAAVPCPYSWPYSRAGVLSLAGGTGLCHERHALQEQGGVERGPDEGGGDKGQVGLHAHLQPVRQPRQVQHCCRRVQAQARPRQGRCSTFRRP